MKKQTDNDNSSASFSGSVQSLEALLAGKIAKLDAFKNVLSAELKLSFEAVLVSGAIVLALLVIMLGLWLGVNSAVALMVFHFTQSLAWTVAIVMTLNLTLCVVLGLALRKSWSLIGLSQTIAVTTEVK